MSEAPKKGFVHLHLHTEYSFLDGACRISDKVLPTVTQFERYNQRAKQKSKHIDSYIEISPLMEQVKDLGQTAVAMTDHGNMVGTLKFIKACKGYGIKPIIGCEFYTVSDINVHDKDEKQNHLILLAKDYEGYLNLCKLNTIAALDGFYKKPRIDLKILKEHSKGLVCLTACIAGHIPQLLLAGKYDEAKAYAEELKSYFDEGDFYIELQNHLLEEELRIMPFLIRLAGDIGVKCVATNDVHYVKKEDSDMHKTLVCITIGRTFDDYETSGMNYAKEEFYLRTEEEMLERFRNIPEAVWNTVEVAEKCNLKLPPKQRLLPAYENEEMKSLGMNSEEYLRHIAYRGLKKRYGEVLPENVVARAEEELGVIYTTRFPDYFLVVWDFVNAAKSMGIPVGPGRGSGVGSIIAYAIGITDIDPLKYSLIFERFLSVDREDYPDFDIDFCCDRRGEVIEYVCEKYGRENTCHIITFGTLKAKQAFRDVCRVFGIRLDETNRIGERIPDKVEKFEHLLKNFTIYDDDNGTSESSNTEVSELIDIYRNDPRFKQIFDIIMKIEGMPRQPGMHAAGVIISKDKVSDYIPLSINQKGGERNVISQYDKTEVEPIGLLKMDFLGLVTLTDIKLALDYVKENHGRTIDFHEIGYEDPEVYKLLGNGDTDAVFQLESAGMKKFMADLKPTCLEDVIAGISLYRPGPMADIPKFIRNKKNPEGAVYLHEKLRPILSVTYGVTIYQEQAMQIARDLGGYTMQEANEFRGVISKKKKEKISYHREKFVAGCVKNGIKESIARSIFASIEAFCSYAFNKSHAAAYAVLGYQTGYLRRYYPQELFTAVLNNRITKSDEIKKYTRIIKDTLGISILPPDINESERRFSTNGSTIRYGLMAIKNVGENAINAVIAERKQNGRYKDLEDFIYRTVGLRERQTAVINKRMIECMIYAGAFDSFGLKRSVMIVSYEKIMEDAEAEAKIKADNQFNMFDMISELSGGERDKFVYPELKEYDQRTKLAKEKEMLGMYMTGHPLQGYEEQFEQFTFNTSMLPKREETDEDDEAMEEAVELRGEDNEETAVRDDLDLSKKLYDGMPVTAGGIRSEAEVKRTKDGNEFAVFSLEDMYGNVEVSVFGTAFQRSKNVLSKESLQTNDMVIVKGRLNMRDPAHIKINAQSVLTWELTDKPHEMTPLDAAVAERMRALYINLDEHVDQQAVVDALENFPGDYPVILYYNRQTYLSEYKIGNIAGILPVLAKIVGRVNVKVVDRTKYGLR